MGEEKKGFASELYFWAQACVFALVVMICINVFFFRLSGVDGHSMEPTLHHKEQIIMRVIGYNEPARGDIVVVRPPLGFDEGSPDSRNKPLVKRVIAISGDVIDIDEATGNVSVNGEVMFEPYISERIRRFGDQQYPLTVPEGHAFVMGDNRNSSTDSRESRVGTLPYDYIVGKVVLRWWPLTRLGLVK